MSKDWLSRLIDWLHAKTKFLPIFNLLSFSKFLKILNDLVDFNEVWDTCFFVIIQLQEFSVLAIVEKSNSL